MLDSAHSAYSIATSTGFHTSTISRLCAKECSELQKSTGGYLQSLCAATTMIKAQCTYHTASSLCRPHIQLPCAATMMTTAQHAHYAA
ncbi:hypothetical protein PAXRUDRAFT_590175, partial [Paxillus rubicundulus Ve08.2h10]